MRIDNGLHLHFHPGNKKLLMRHYGMIIILLFFSRLAIAQEVPTDTVIELDTVTISAAREAMFTQGLKVTSIDSAALNEPANSSLGELLERETVSYIKSYGQGSIASISMRGASSSQTGILWNGLNILQPSTGMTDLSLVRSAFFEEAAIVYGGSSLIYGSGMIGGAVLLGDKPSFTDRAKISVGLNAGSFDRYESIVGIYLGNRKVSSKTVVAGLSAENNFPYLDLTRNEQRLSHASVKNIGFIHDMAVKTGADSYLQTGVWYQESTREVPPTLVMSTSEAVLYDRFIRAMAGWYLQSEKVELSFVGGYFNELETYRDPVTEISSRIQNQTAALKLSSQMMIARNQQLLAGMSGRFVQADIEAYNGLKSELSGSAFASYLLLFPSVEWKATAGSRIALNEGFPVAFLPSIGLEGKVLPNTSIRFNASRNFRAPTLNERFWIPGGNPGLLPEVSWNAEAGADYRKESDHAGYYFGGTFFTYLVDNWILWVPRGPLWAAENVLKVWSRGVEVTGSQDLRIGDRWRVKLDEGYTYTRATREKKISENDQGVGRQLIYTPMHKARLGVEAGFENYRMRIDTRGTGKVYTTTDNEHSVAGYILTDISLSGKFLVGRHVLNAGISALNIFNQEYAVVEYRPMPGISFLASVKLFINIK